MISFISRNYLDSENCKDELTFANDKNKKQLLVYLDDITMPDGLAMRFNRYQHLSYLSLKKRGVFYEKLFKALSGAHFGKS